MSKVFKIDDFTITLEDALFDEACRVYVLEDENNLIYSDTKEECRNGNYIHLKNDIRAAFTKSLDDLGKITLEYIRKNFTDKEISQKVSECLVSEIEINGGHYNL